MGTNSIPSGWQLTNLGNIAKKEYGLVDGPFGSNLPASAYVPLGVPVIRGSNLSLGNVSFKGDEFVYVSEETAKRLERSLCEPEDIIFTKKGTLGQTGFVPTAHRYKKFLVSSNQMKLSVNRNIAEPRFVYYYVSSPASREKIIRDSEVTGVPKTNLAYLRTFPIVLPPLDEQKAIAHILGTLDDKIELNQQMNQTLEAIARALFKSWFIDFDPVRAKMDGRQPAGMDAETAALFPDEFEDSAISTIPKGWKVQPAGQICQLKYGKIVPKKQLLPYGYPVWSGYGIVGYHTEFMFEKPEVSITCRGVGGTGNVHMTPPNCWVTNLAITIIPNDPIKLKREYLFWAMKESNTSDLITGSAQYQITINSLSNHLLLIPSQVLIEKFSEVATMLHQKIEVNTQQSEALCQIRDVLLSKLLSGEICVKDAEKMAEVLV